MGFLLCILEGSLLIKRRQRGSVGWQKVSFKEKGGSKERGKMLKYGKCLKTLTDGHWLQAAKGQRR